MAVQYDPKIIAQHAEALYRRASRIVFTHGFMGLIVGGNKERNPQPVTSSESWWHPRSFAGHHFQERGT